MQDNPAQNCLLAMTVQHDTLTPDNGQAFADADIQSKS